MDVVPSGCVVKVLHQSVTMLQWTYSINDFNNSISVCKNCWLLFLFYSLLPLYYEYDFVLMALDCE